MTEMQTPLTHAAGATPAPPMLAGMPEAKLRARGLDFFYGDYRALKSINIDVPEHRVTAIIGPSGCGKSTLLRIFNRIYSVYPKLRAEGEVLLDGEDVLDPRYPLNRLRSKVGMVFQKPVPFPMSIYDNIAYGIRHYEKLSPAARAARAERAPRTAALGDEPKKKLKGTALGLPGGQQQPLCTPRATALKPEVTLFDEPPSALAPIATGKIEQLVEELKT